MGDQFLFSSDYQLPLTEYDDFILTYPGVGEMVAAGMWQTQSLPSTGSYKGPSEPETVVVAKVTTEKVETSDPSEKGLIPSESKNMSEKYQAPIESGLGLAGSGIEVRPEPGRMVTSICVPIHQLSGPSDVRKGVKRPREQGEKKPRTKTARKHLPKFSIMDK